jgi:hypothetical protein
VTPLKNAKHEHFARLVSNGETPARAYALAGYSEKGARQSAHALLTKPDVSDRVSYLRSKKEEKHEAAVAAVIAEAAVDKAWVLSQLVENVKMGKAAEPVLDNEGAPVGEYKQNLAAANKALELIGKELGMFVDRKEIRTGPLDGLGHEELRQLHDAIGSLASAAEPQPASAVGTRH